ncbi:MAG: NAD(P)/FAD-dependent oxidoreductase [Epsilonproteobacteria bacterium]|nr:NAD(P)/FAD-dependent oxidoreductase [Campylobacterota bacterium]
MERRDLFKVAGVGVAAVTLSACTASNAASSAVAGATKAFRAKSTGKRVVVVGGGFGGLTMAKQLRAKDKSLEVIVLEKKDIFMACPYSNTYLGGLKGVNLDTLTHDYYAPANAHGYEFIQTEVTGIDRGSKTVTTTSGTIDYDILVLSPGIAYDYAKQFPTWSKEKISHVARACPAALMPGSEHLALKRQLNDMDDGDVIIIPPAKGKYRCPPAPYERTAMVANYIKQEGIEGKVIVLDTRGGKFAKGKAFKESWKEIYGDLIDYRGSTEIMDVDPVKKTVTFKEFANDDDEKGTVKTHKYEVCNLIPNNVASPLIRMSGVKTNGAGYAIMDGTSFRSKTDKNIYVIGDCVGHGIPPSGQTAIWGAKRAASEIVAQLGGAAFDSGSGLPANNANVCFSMVNGNPNEAIMVTHTFSVNPANGNLKGKGNVPKPKDGGGKFRSAGTGKLTTEWFNGVMREMFL